jgi:deazaflavin-dependent oxidoreductase (nitroreductase family)
MMNDVDVLKLNEKNIAEFRSTGGKLASFGDAPVVLLTTVGAKSGKKRTSPMMYLADDNDPNRIYVFASAAGADTNPAWYHNIVAHPSEIEVELGTNLTPGKPEVLPEPQRTEIYAIQAARYPGFAEYQSKTKRPIPVIAITLMK